MSNEKRALAATVREEPVEAGDRCPMLVHPGWAGRFPWLCQGMTTKGSGFDGEAFDLRLFGPDGSPAGGPSVIERWRRILLQTGFVRAVHARQLHGRDLEIHPPLTPHCTRGLYLAPDGDGQCTAATGILLTVATADCVPVSIVDAQRQVVSLLHAGWRGVAAGILEEGLRVLRGRFASDAGQLHVHLGPAICGACYEVGPEVFAELDLPVPPAPAMLDLRAVLRDRARDAGVPHEQVTTSAFCTRCGDSPFFSHRRGDHGRQVALLGLRASA